MKRIFALLLVLGQVAALGACRDPASDESSLSANEIVDLVERLAFVEPLNETAVGGLRLARDPINLAVFAHGGGIGVAGLEEVVIDLSEVTGLTIHDISAYVVDDPNLVIVTTDSIERDLFTHYDALVRRLYFNRSDYRSLAQSDLKRDPGCFHRSLVAEGSISLTLALVDNSIGASDAAACVMRNLLFHAGLLGAFEPESKLTYSRNGNFVLDERAMLILRLLYDPRISAGMTKKQVLETVRQILGITEETTAFLRYNISRIS